MTEREHLWVGFIDFSYSICQFQITFIIHYKNRKETRGEIVLNNYLGLQLTLEGICLTLPEFRMDYNWINVASG